MSVNTQVRRKRTRTNPSMVDGLNGTGNSEGCASGATGASMNGNVLTGTDSFLERMLDRQSSFLQNTLRDGLNFVDDTNVRQNCRGVMDSSNMDSGLGEHALIDSDNAMIEVDNAYVENAASYRRIDEDVPGGHHEHIVEDDEDENEQVDDDGDDDVIFIKEQPVYFNSPLVTEPGNSNYTSTTSKKFKKQRTISLPQLPHAKLLYQNRQDIPRGQNNDELLHLTGSTAKTLDGNRSVNLRVIKSTSPLLSDPFYNSSTSPSNSPNESTISDSQFLHKRNKDTDNAIHEKKGLKRLAAPRIAAKLVGRKDKLKKKDYFKTDKDGHYIYQENDVFSDGRFIVKQLLGQGTFGKVLKCLDTRAEVVNQNHFWNYTSTTHEKAFVAIKIIRAIDRYREAAKTELRVLQAVMENDPQGQYQCLMLKECFDYRNHICIVTDLLGKSVYDFMCSNGVARFPGSHVQAIAKQLIRSVCFLHDLGIIHTDLKPENILLCDETYVEKELPISVIRSMSIRRKDASGGRRKFLTDPEIKIIDFGSAVFHNEYHPPVISTRHYRAPEIVLGLGWSFPCDIWSIACILVELVTGESLYPIHENLEHMAMMQRINGEPFPPKIVEKMFYKITHKIGNSPSDLNATVVKHFDKESLALQWPEKNKRGDYVTKEKSIKRVMGTCDRLDIHVSKRIRQDYGEWISINWNFSPDRNWSLIKSKILTERKNKGTTAGDLNKETFLFWYWFVDLCRKMFEFDPTKRITAREALDHEWFNLGILDEGITCSGKF